MRIRLAEASDAEAIRAIYNAEVTSSVVTFDIVPWTLGDQLAWLEHHRGAHPAIVAVDGEAEGDGPSEAPVLGYGSLSPYRPRPAYATTVEDSVYVGRDARGQGVGRRLLEELIRLAADHGFHTIIGRTEGGNEASIALHTGCGFEIVGVEREVGRKHGRWLDVVELQLLL
ncbi:MAG TPA: GNAT family N-acetyltransferase [Acidimicrobiales bacterium]|nr:GNAT family N-acetyltransferase [Acidimicrobiales bacterium]